MGGIVLRMYDIIAKKRDGNVLTPEEIQFFISGYTLGNIPDYQAAALLMAIYLKGMSHEETALLTDCVAKSGDLIDLSEISGKKVDKHSTGGVGDKTTLVITPILAACGAKVAKMSGRGLGHTGGTVDKMEAIPGMKTALTKEEFIHQVNSIGISVIGQTGNIAPADKKLYALRDVTATVGCIPLIASSIMGKKIAAGADCILLDVKTGSGSFMKTVDDSIRLAETMVAIGSHVGRNTAAIVTDMDIPLGYAIGNSLEVIEAIDVLRGHGPDDLTKVCYELATGLLELADFGTHDACMSMVLDAVSSGKAFEKLRELVIAQGGDVSVIDNTTLFETAKVAYEVKSLDSGYISHMNTDQCGVASVVLGGGRETKESAIDFSAGIMIAKKTGDFVNKGDVLATLYTSTKEKACSAEQVYLSALSFASKAPSMRELVLAKVTSTGVTKY